MLIVTGSDDNYVPGVLVLIASAALHNPAARFAVLDMGISQQNRGRIDALSARIGRTITRIEITGDVFSHLLVARKHLTRSTYLRLLIPDLFPEEQRVLYMDCDMVVMDDLSDLDRVDLGNALVAAVPCPSPDLVEVEATGHIDGSYVNAGLLVMNLPVWRAEHVASTCLALLSDPAKPLLSEDQSAINILGKGRILLLDRRFNIYSDPAGYDRIEDFPAHPAVLHYVVNNKPWKGPTTMGRVWHFHAARIADLIPPRQPVSLRRRVSQLNRQRKLALGVLLRRPKYLLRRKVVAFLNGPATETYLARARSIAADRKRRGETPPAPLSQAGSLAKRR